MHDPTNMKLRTLLAKWEHGEIGLAALDNELHHFYLEGIEDLSREKWLEIMMPFHGGNPRAWEVAMDRVYDDHFYLKRTEIKNV